MLAPMHAADEVCVSCRAELAVRHLQQGRRIHVHVHCRRCCHHAAQSCSSCTCVCAASHALPSGYQTAHGALSFLQPPCTAQMAKERHLPFEWSLTMRAFASWKVWNALPRPHVAAYAESTEQLVYIIQMHMCPDSINSKSCSCISFAVTARLQLQFVCSQA